jgi:hypothetical protein
LFEANGIWSDFAAVPQIAKPRFSQVPLLQRVQGV